MSSKLQLYVLSAAGALCLGLAAMEAIAKAVRRPRNGTKGQLKGSFHKVYRQLALLVQSAASVHSGKRLNQSGLWLAGYARA